VLSRTLLLGSLGAQCDHRTSGSISPTHLHSPSSSESESPNLQREGDVNSGKESADSVLLERVRDNEGERET
jgi:hypothetical protein